MVSKYQTNRDNLIRNYFSLLNYTKEELELLDTIKDSKIKIDDEKFNELTTEYLKLMPCANISTESMYMTFGESGTELLEEVFKKEVDDETLVISTVFEHPSVQNCLKDVKNKIILETTNEIRNIDVLKLAGCAKQYKRVFVYIIGTQLTTGEITPQETFYKIKDIFDKEDIKYKLFIDDVHGMFVVPRDYSIFDYVLYTAHAIVPKYEMGLLLSKDNTIGIKAYNWGKDYLERLNIIKNKFSIIFLLRTVINEYLYDIINDENFFKQYTHCSDHVFAVYTKDIFYTEKEAEELEKYYIIVNKQQIKDNFIRIRFQEFSRLDTEKALEGLNLLRKILSKKIFMKYLKEGK